MNIGWAVQATRNGRAVRRKAWAVNTSIALVRPRAATPTGIAPPPILELSGQGRRVPCVLTTTDLIATDWTYA
jgi:hypothetical protein